MAYVAIDSAVPHASPAVCLACGARIAGPLAALGSLRCVDCRSGHRSLDEALVRRFIDASIPRRRRP